jgi:hypothetical protein
MDDQQGNVIDGTARARQWRRSRSKSPADVNGGEPHSEAPKSIASSLLVPADMLDGALVSAGEASPRGGAVGDAVVAEPPGATAVGEAFAAATSHDNLFLSPDAAVVDPTRRRSTRRRAPALRRLRNEAVARLRTVLEIRPSRPSFGVQRPRRVVAVLGVAGLLAVIAVLVVDSATTSSSVSRSSTHTGSVAELDRLKATVLSAVGRFFAAVPATTRVRPAHARPARKRTIHTRPRTHTATRRSGTVPVTSSYTPPPTASSVTSSSGGASSGVSASSGSAASPSTSDANPSSTSAGSTSAFGLSGVLGPGSSPNG